MDPMSRLASVYIPLVYIIDTLDDLETGMLISRSWEVSRENIVEQLLNYAVNGHVSLFNVASVLNGAKVRKIHKQANREIQFLIGSVRNYAKSELEEEDRHTDA